MSCIATQGPLAELFDQQQLLYDVSGAGNNWAHGHHGYGPQYREQLCEQLWRAAEDADSLQVRGGAADASCMHGLAVLVIVSSHMHSSALTADELG
jgi:hypothetical protein